MLRFVAWVAILLSGLGLLVAGLSLNLGGSILALTGLLAGCLALMHEETHARLERLEAQIRRIPVPPPPQPEVQQWEAEDVVVGAAKPKGFEFLSDVDGSPDVHAAPREAWEQQDESAPTGESPDEWIADDGDADAAGEDLSDAVDGDAADGDAVDDDAVDDDAVDDDEPPAASV